MRIATISIHSCPLAPLGGVDTGGMNVYVREVSKELGRRGIDVDIFTRAKSPAIPQVVDITENVRVVHLPAGEMAPYGKELIADHIPQFVEGVRRFAEAGKISYDLIHSHYWLSGLVAEGLRTAWGTPFIQMFHTLGKLKNMIPGNKIKREPVRRIESERVIISKADRLVASSALEKNQMIRYYEAEEDKVRVIPCGVDVNLFKPMPKEEARAHLNLDHENIVLFVGRIEPIKGIDTLIEAVAMLDRDNALRKPIKLMLVGGVNNHNGSHPAPEEMTRLKRITRELGVNELVQFVGPLKQERLPYYYSAADVCVLPSYYESFGMVAVEAMACGTPMIASRVGGLPYTIKEGGYLVPEGEAAELAEKMRIVLTDEEVQSRLGDKGVKTAREYGWDTIASKLLRVYQELMEVKPSNHDEGAKSLERIIECPGN